VSHRGKVELTAAQRRALLVLASKPGASLTRTEYARLNGVARSQASHDLSELVLAGLLARVGRGRSTRYELAHEAAAQQVWTPGPTRRKLEANELGIADRAAFAARAPRRGRLGWALVGVAALAALGAAARGLPLVAMHGFGSTIRAITGAAAPVKPPSAHGSGDELFRPRPAPTVAATHAGVRAPKPKPDRITRPAAKPPPPVQQTYAPQRTYVSNVVQTVPARTAPPPSKNSSAAATPPEHGLAPLRAPAGGSPPSPLKAP
jgi:DNA-binding transcriptional ArsR family regulator